MTSDACQPDSPPPASEEGVPRTILQFKKYFADARFHQTFQLPADPSRGRHAPFAVKYADFGFHQRSGASQEQRVEEGKDDRDKNEGDKKEKMDEEENVLLFFGPLLATRMLHVTKDAMAKRHHVRIVNLDRPGIGGTDAVPADKLLETWRDVIPALLQHLGIRHVSIVCQSGGIIYALDAILHNPQILHPSRPYLAMGGPWVHPSHTSVSTMGFVSGLPISLLGQTDKLASFINARVIPLMGSSINLFDKAKRWVLGDLVANHPPGAGNDTAEARFEESSTMTMFQAVFAEGVVGISEEAKLLLRRVDGAVGWSDWGDVDAAVPRLVPALRDAGITAQLRVDIFFAAKDSMIGNVGSKGPCWLEECFRREERGGGHGGLKVSCATMESAEHDTVLDMRWDAMEQILKTIAAKGRGSVL
ncbi:hypothetical protein DCS_00399 [Drechmeria coniospora]|uniref:AB hydrolase-1 domain-containing protein n=1 Tax=Drechmeria coniospora TaxID=98403 RepID=A0A151GQ86_DRECN|nr:hypothetical protein DCS_00399 [Drechmeria coniospora]KYK59269.1 hypothetical protein DCS_00399 [Drechmeria coniospora]ODA78008.1 hypothetical protein RJ55_06611 [Drechmeria coniospora]